MGYDRPKLIDIVGFECLCARVGELGMFLSIGEEMRIGGEPLKAINNKPVLAPQDHEVLTSQVIKVCFEIAAVVVDRPLGGFGQVVEGACLGRARVLPDMSLEEVDRLVQFHLANVLQVILSCQSQ